jgi:glycosyltransferase involved in cell wall biosynthesis
MVASRTLPDIGGIESHVKEVATRIAAHGGYDLEVLVTDRTGKLAKHEVVDGYTIRRFPAYPREKDWYLSPGLFWAVLRAKADLIHVQGIHTLVPPLAMLAAILRRTPFLLTFHTGGNSSAFREAARGTQFKILSPLLRRAFTLIGVSEFEAKRFEAIVGREIKVVRNGGSLPPVPEDVAPEPALVTSVGRIERYKGHHKAVEALPYLLKTHPEARVEILGAGPYEDELCALADRLGVRDKVTIRLIPPADRALMGETIARVGVMTLLSDYEAHPVAVMEALAAGRPAVVSRTSGLTELADLGWVVGVDQDASAEETAEAIRRQIDEPVVPDAAVLPTWETCVAGVTDTYGSIVASRSSTQE